MSYHSLLLSAVLFLAAYLAGSNIPCTSLEAKEAALIRGGQAGNCSYPVVDVSESCRACQAYAGFPYGKCQDYSYGHTCVSYVNPEPHLSSSCADDARTCDGPVDSYMFNDCTDFLGLLEVDCEHIVEEDHDQSGSNVEHCPE